MTGKDLTKISRDYIEAFNAANWTRVKETLAGNSLYNEVGTQRRIQGADAIITALQAWKRPWPQARRTDSAIRLSVVLPVSRNKTFNMLGGLCGHALRRQALF